MNLPLACLAVMLCLATAGAAQQRRPLFATVVDDAGEPIAGAEGRGGEVVFTMVATRSTQVRVIGASVPVQFAAQGAFVFRTDNSITSGAHAVPIERIGATDWSVSASGHGFLPRIAMQAESREPAALRRDADRRTRRALLDQR